MPGLLYHLGQVARERRREKNPGFRHIDISKSDAALARFEKGQQWTELEATVDAYAKAVGVEPIELWETAIENWRAAELEAGRNRRRAARASESPSRKTGKARNERASRKTA